MSLTDTSRFISLILRHKPETIGITLDEHGWANVNELIEGISENRRFDMEMLEEIVRTDNKQRYSFNEDKTLKMKKIFYYKCFLHDIVLVTERVKLSD